MLSTPRSVSSRRIWVCVSESCLNSTPSTCAMPWITSSRSAGAIEQAAGGLRPPLDEIASREQIARRMACRRGGEPPQGFLGGAADPAAILLDLRGDVPDGVGGSDVREAAQRFAHGVLIGVL